MFHFERKMLAYVSGTFQSFCIAFFVINFVIPGFAIRAILKEMERYRLMPYFKYTRLQTGRKTNARSTVKYCFLKYHLKLILIGILLLKLIDFACCNELEEVWK